MSLKKPTVFTGVATAAITPFFHGSVDYPALDGFLESQIGAGIGAILLAGTTGEGCALSFAEHGELIAYAKKRIAGRVPLIAGCGSNVTSRAAELAETVCNAGADAVLAVTPYYNKTSDRGLILHYQAIAEASSRPVIVYNVPSRTGVRISLPIYRELAKIDRICAVKEASGDLGLLHSVVAECGDALDVYTGNDDQTVAAMRLGARGVISVYSNLDPRASVTLCRLAAEGDFRRAERLASSLLPRMRALFEEVNPIPVKYVAARMGLCQPEYRLPLCPPSPDLARHLNDLFRESEL